MTASNLVTELELNEFLALISCSCEEAKGILSFHVLLVGPGAYFEIIEKVSARIK